MLHLASRLGELGHHRPLVETAVTTAAALGAEWIITPELCLCGYQFTGRIGTAWIEPQPDRWMKHLSPMAAHLHVTIFLSHPERDGDTDKCYNTVFVIGPDGTWVEVHRKVNVVPGAEAWATCGNAVVPIVVPPLRVGILICAEAYPAAIAKPLQAHGAEILVSRAAWPPWPHGPDGAWEQRTRETGLPLFVCNRTGTDETLNFVKAESVVVRAGERLLTFSGLYSTLLLVDWDVHTRTIVGQRYQRIA